MEISEFLIGILPGLCVCIPLVIALGIWISKAIKNKDWQKVVSFVLDHMEEAEKRFEAGSDRKAYVMAAVITSAKSIGYPLTESDTQKISDMIDQICDAAKVINVEAPAPADAE